MQQQLSSNQVSEFYHDLFVTDQLAHFNEFLGKDVASLGTTVDIGGGCGFFARALAGTTHLNVRVLDIDETSLKACREAGVGSDYCDALSPTIRGDEEVACFNLVLHHLVAATARSTRAQQVRALAAWSAQVRYVFVNEYIYESYVWPKLSAFLIWTVTSSTLLSTVAKLVSRWVPSLRANTLGVGVRFRARREWEELFSEAGYRVVGHLRGEEEPVSLARRAMLIKSGRRDSFLLRPK
jgi:hypothetical protein